MLWMVHLGMKGVEFKSGMYVCFIEIFRNESVQHTEVLHRHTTMCRKHGSDAWGDFRHRCVSNLGKF